MNIPDELQKLQQLHQSGALSDEEYARAKAKLLGNSAPPVSPSLAAGPAGVDQTKQWSMFLHLSQLAGVLIPFAGLIAPILIWQLKKAEMPGLDAHGKVVVNWIISAIIYAIISAVLALVGMAGGALVGMLGLTAIIGIPMLIAVSLLCIIFPIIGGIKANNGELWKYPISITFFK